MHSVMDGLFASIENFPESPHALEWKSTANHYLDQYLMEPNENPPGPSHTPLTSQMVPCPATLVFPTVLLLKFGAVHRRSTRYEVCSHCTF